MEDQINKLIRLQAIDSQIYNLNKEKEEKPKEISELDNKFEEKKRHLVQIEKNLKELQVKRKEKELELSTKEDDVRKYQIQLYQVKTNKEYASLQKEIEGLKADNSLLEEEIIGILDQIDRLKEDIFNYKKTLEIEENKVKEQKKIVEDRIEQNNKELQNLSSQREALIPQIDGSVLSKYERILKNKDSLALVPVRNNACQGCFMNLPPQVINEIKMKRELVICEVCTRILYIEE